MLVTEDRSQPSDALVALLAPVSDGRELATRLSRMKEWSYNIPA